MESPYPFLCVVSFGNGLLQYINVLGIKHRDIMTIFLTLWSLFSAVRSGWTSNDDNLMPKDVALLAVGYYNDTIFLMYALCKFVFETRHCVETMNGLNLCVLSGGREGIISYPYTQMMKYRNFWSE